MDSHSADENTGTDGTYSGGDGGWLAHPFHASITLTEAAPPLRLRSGQALCDFQRVGFSSSLHRGRFTTSAAHVLLYALLILKMQTGLS